MSQRIQALLVNALVAAGVLVLLHVFFVAVPSRLAERSASEPLATPAEVAPGADLPAAAAEPVADVAAEPVHGPSGMAPGILAAPDRS